MPFDDEAEPVRQQSAEWHARRPLPPPGSSWFAGEAGPASAQDLAAKLGSDFRGRMFLMTARTGTVEVKFGGDSVSVTSATDGHPVAPGDQIPVWFDPRGTETHVAVLGDSNHLVLTPYSP